MESSRVGRSLRAARARRGWTREELAVHSGVSWSAIAQIELGRRTDVRLSTLSAVADALGVSVDSLIGTAAALDPRLFEHRVLPYGSDEDFLATAIPYLAEGAERSEDLLAVLTEAQLEVLRDGLDGGALPVDLIDSADWYRSPAEALDRYRAYLKEHFEAGVPWIRVLGELPLRGLPPAEVAAWTRYESVVNLVFASAPATIVCAYDTTSLPTRVVTEAGRAHPSIAEGAAGAANPSYRDPEDLLLGPTAAPRG